MSVRGLTNVVLKDGTSLLLRESGRDPSYIVGVMSDLRGMPTSDSRRIPRDNVLLDFSIREAAVELIHADDYSYNDIQRITEGEKV